MAMLNNQRVYNYVGNVGMWVVLTYLDLVANYLLAK